MWKITLQYLNQPEFGTFEITYEVEAPDYDRASSWGWDKNVLFRRVFKTECTDMLVDFIGEVGA